MKNILVNTTLFLCFLFLGSCGSNSDDSPSDSGISINPNTISIETLYGTWETTHFLDEDNSHEIDLGFDYYDNYRCPEKPTSRGYYVEGVFGITEDREFSKSHSIEEWYVYDDSVKNEYSVWNFSTCDISGQRLELKEEEIRYDPYEIVGAIVKDNKIYYEIKEFDGYKGYYYYQVRFTFEHDRILYSFIDHLGKQASLEAITELDFTDFQILKKVSNEVDLARFNNGKEWIERID